MLVGGKWEVEYREDLMKFGRNSKENAKTVGLHNSKFMLYLMYLLYSVTSFYII